MDPTLLVFLAAVFVLAVACVLGLMHLARPRPERQRLQRLGGGLRRPVMHHEARPGGMQAPCGRGADTMGAAGNEDDFLVQGLGHGQ